MAKMSEYAFIASILMTAFALVLYIFYAVSGVRAARMQTAGGPGSGAGGTVGFMSGPRTGELGRYASIFVWLATALLGASMVFRAVVTGHGPFANMYEFSMAFAFGILVTYSWFEHKYHQRILALIALPVALAMLLYAATIPADRRAARPRPPEQPAPHRPRRGRDRCLRLLRHRVRRLAAVPAPGPVGDGGRGHADRRGPGRDRRRLIMGQVTGLLAGLLLGAVVGGLIGGIARWSGVGASLSDSDGGRWGLPKPQVLDEIGYRAVVIGFPFLTLTIILGAVWADTAWGTYWSWDPKETASLVTWFIYGAYLHARVMRGWRGDRAAWLLVLGFVATLFTYFGNLFFGGLHSYSGLG